MNIESALKKLLLDTISRTSTWNHLTFDQDNIGSFIESTQYEDNESSENQRKAEASSMVTSSDKITTPADMYDSSTPSADISRVITTDSASSIDQTGQQSYSDDFNIIETSKPVASFSELQSSFVKDIEQLTRTSSNQTISYVTALIDHIIGYSSSTVSTFSSDIAKTLQLDSNVSTFNLKTFNVTGEQASTLPRSSVIVEKGATITFVKSERQHQITSSFPNIISLTTELIGTDSLTLHVPSHSQTTGSSVQDRNTVTVESSNQETDLFSSFIGRKTIEVNKTENLNEDYFAEITNTSQRNKTHISSSSSSFPTTLKQEASSSYFNILPETAEWKNNAFDIVSVSAIFETLKPVTSVTNLQSSFVKDTIPLTRKSTSHTISTVLTKLQRHEIRSANSVISDISSDISRTPQLDSNHFSLHFNHFLTTEQATNLSESSVTADRTLISSSVKYETTKTSSLHYFLSTPTETEQADTSILILPSPTQVMKTPLKINETVIVDPLLETSIPERNITNDINDQSVFDFAEIANTAQRYKSLKQETHLIADIQHTTTQSHTSSTFIFNAQIQKTTPWSVGYTEAVDGYLTLLISSQQPNEHSVTDFQPWTTLYEDRVETYTDIQESSEDSRHYYINEFKQSDLSLSSSVAKSITDENSMLTIDHETSGALISQFSKELSVGYSRDIFLDYLEPTTQTESRMSTAVFDGQHLSVEGQQMLTFTSVSYLVNQQPPVSFEHQLQLSIPSSYNSSSPLHGVLSISSQFEDPQNNQTLRATEVINQTVHGYKSIQNKESVYQSTVLSSDQILSLHNLPSYSTGSPNFVQSNNIELFPSSTSTSNETHVSPVHGHTINQLSRSEVVLSQSTREIIYSHIVSLTTSLSDVSPQNTYIEDQLIKKDEIPYNTSKQTLRESFSTTRSDSTIIQRTEFMDNVKTHLSHTPTISRFSDTNDLSSDLIGTLTNNFYFPLQSRLPQDTTSSINQSLDDKRGISNSILETVDARGSNSIPEYNASISKSSPFTDDDTYSITSTILTTFQTLASETANISKSIDQSNSSHPSTVLAHESEIIEQFHSVFPMNSSEYSSSIQPTVMETEYKPFDGWVESKPTMNLEYSSNKQLITLYSVSSQINNLSMPIYSTAITTESIEKPEPPSASP